MFVQVEKVVSPEEVKDKLFMRPYQTGFTFSRGLRNELSAYLSKNLPHDDYPPRRAYLSTMLYCTVHVDEESKLLRLDFTPTAVGLNIFKVRLRHSFEYQSALQIPRKTLVVLLEQTSKDRFYLTEHTKTEDGKLQSLTFSYTPKEKVKND